MFRNADGDVYVDPDVLAVWERDRVARAQVSAARLRRDARRLVAPSLADAEAQIGALRLQNAALVEEVEMLRDRVWRLWRLWLYPDEGGADG